MAEVKYHKPGKRVHRGFYYLDDETVINSLSAVEAGKVDEIVAKVISAREGGFGAGVGIQGLKAEGSKKSTSSFEEEIVRTRTRFSAFELWYQHLVAEKALGRFTSWGPGALADVDSGDTVELYAKLEVIPLHGLFHMYLWFAKQAQTQGTFFSQKGEELKSTKEAERNMKNLMGDLASDEVVLIATPEGDPGPPVALQLDRQWMIGELGRLAGWYRVIAQVEQVLEPGEEYPTMRLTHDAPPMPLEISTFKEAVGVFVESAKALGVEASTADASVEGPAFWLRPIAIFR